jgi:glycosyltransferase involved in cell wall biosynthesis
MKQSPLRVAFCLPGLHRVVRGAEVALESIATEVAQLDGFEVSVFGSGQPRPTDPYRFVHVPCLPRERFEGFPCLPAFRTESNYEEFTFVPGLLRHLDPKRFDVIVTCSYPFVHWAVRTRRGLAKRPAQVFVTQNGDWPLYRKNSEYRLFASEGVVCTNPDYFDAHGANYNARLIPNGVDPDVFFPGGADRARLGLPPSGPIVLMVSALISSKRVLEGVSAVAKVPNAQLVVAGDGPLRDEVDALAKRELGSRFLRMRVARKDMPDLYRCADVFLHMSLDEPSANAYLEALASGLPIVTHDRRVTRWTLERFGSFVDATDLDAVAGAVSEAIARAPNRQEAADAARQRFSWKSIAKQYGEFFGEVAQ